MSNNIPENKIIKKDIGFTWNDLVKIVEKMPKHLRDDYVYMWNGEGVSQRIDEIEILAESYYNDEYSEYGVTYSEAKKDGLLSEVSLTHKKGTRIIHF